MEAIQPALEAWFEAVTNDSAPLVIPTCSYASITTTAFPALINGIYPATIIDQRGFSPLMDMRYGLAWRLHCGQVLTTTTGPALQHFSTFLHCGAAGITPDMYLHAAIPGRFCPNFGFHFQPHNQVWPTLADPIEHFKSPLLVSLEAQNYEPVIIEVHGDRWAPIPALLTCNERSTQRHHANTPRHSRVSPRQGTRISPHRPPPLAPPADPLPPPGQHTPIPDPHQAHPYNPLDPPHPTASLRRSLPRQSRQYNPFEDLAKANSPPPTRHDAIHHQTFPGIPQPSFQLNWIQPFSPPLPHNPVQHQGTTMTPFSHCSARNLFPPALGPTSLVQPPPVSTRQVFDYNSATIYTDEHRAMTNMEFLSICLLLTHYSPDFSLYDTIHRCQIPITRISSPANHASMHIARSCLLWTPLSQVSSCTRHTLIWQASSPPTVLTFIKPTMVISLRSSSFALFSTSTTGPSALMPDPFLNPMRVPSQLSTSLIFCAPSHPLAPDPAYSPVRDLLISRLVMLAHSYFTVSQPLTLTFCASLLGSRLWAWLALLNDSAVLLLWDKFPRTVSYQWMLSCWSLLNLFKRWLEAVRWQPARGFATVQDSATLLFHVIADGTITSGAAGQSWTVLTTLLAFDSSFHDLWSNRVMVHNDMLWTLPPLADHFVQICPLPSATPCPAAVALLPSSFQYPSGNPPSSAGLSKCQLEPFMASQGLLELASPIPPGQRLMTYLFNAMPMNTTYPRMQNNDGKNNCLMCLRSAFPAPHNLCHLHFCIAVKHRKHHSPRLHIDLSQEPWRSKPEAYWQPVVDWLLHPGVDALIHPTVAFQKLTPSAKWP